MNAVLNLIVRTIRKLFFNPVVGDYIVYTNNFIQLYPYARIYCADSHLYAILATLAAWHTLDDHNYMADRIYEYIIDLRFSNSWYIFCYCLRIAVIPFFWYVFLCQMYAPCKFAFGWD